MKAAQKTNSKRTDRRRSGIFSVELVFTLPILGLVLLAFFEFSLLFSARGEVAHACRLAARKASLPGVTSDDIQNEVQRILSPQLGRRVRVLANLGEHTGDVVGVAVAVPMKAASPDLLWPIGYSLEGRELYVETHMFKE